MTENQDPQDEAGLIEAEVVGDADDSEGRQVIEGPKLMRIASMTRALLDEVRHAPLDDAGRRRLVEVHVRSLTELHEVLPDELSEEMSDIFLPLSGETATESEVRVAQAQLVGWLEGLFAGIQATLFSQQAAMANQLEAIRGRAIEAHSSSGPIEPPGQYL